MSSTREQSSENAGFARVKLLPLLLTVDVVLLDQLTKYLIVANIPPYTVGASFFDGFLRIIHVSNLGAAFSLGDGLDAPIRSVLLAYMPLVVLGIVCAVYFRSNEFTRLQRWSIAGILGGGIGNLIDRFFRPEGVVDFIDIRFFGLFGLERWPAFNIADMSIVICGVLLIISFAAEIKTGKTA